MAYSKQKRDLLIALRGAMLNAEIAREKHAALAAAALEAERAIGRFGIAWAKAMQRR